MVTIQRNDRRRPAYLFLFILVVAFILFLGGCAVAPPVTPDAVKVRSETEIAVRATKDEWLKECEGVPAGLTENTIGQLLQDYVDAAAALAVCMRRHNDYVQYMKDVVAKEKAK